MIARALLPLMLAFSLALTPFPGVLAAQVDPSWNIANGEAEGYIPNGIDKIQTMVVIYGENRSFDHLYGFFPGANGLANLRPEDYQQRDRKGSLMKTLPPFWTGIQGFTVAQTAGLPNRPFALDDPALFRAPVNLKTGDLVHRFYQNQMQIDGGSNSKFAAWSDAGGLTMAHYRDTAAALPMWKVAQRYVLADNFFQAAFGGSLLNHHFLICACAPMQNNPYDQSVSIVDGGPLGTSLTVLPDPVPPATVLPPIKTVGSGPFYAMDGRLSPDRYAVNTAQPPYQPSATPPAPDASGAALLLADANPGAHYPGKGYPPPLSPSTDVTIGDYLTEAGVSWAWYAGAWDDALANRSHIYNDAVPNFQPHHQPFNYYANYAPGTPGREHLKDGGLAGVRFIEDIDHGKLPQVSFYKPQGDLNEHPGYADVASGDAHIADVISHLQNGPQWANMLVIVVYDEAGGFWDHAAPPAADRWGPGTRIPAIIVSPFAKAGTVNHSPYDTTSIIRFIAKRFLQKPLGKTPAQLFPGIALRDQKLKEHGFRTPADFSGALNLQ